MKTTLQTAALLFCACAALGQGTLQIVVPGGLANVEGNSSTSEPFTSSSFRVQMVFAASQFPLPTGSSVSNGVANIGFRIDASAVSSAAFSFGGASIRLSTTQKTPDSLSPVFAENIGPDVTTIYTGGVGFGNLYQPGAAPQPFLQSVPATTPFYYNPSRGNLLLDIQGRSGQVLFPGDLDAQGTVSDCVSRVFASSELSSSGTVDSLGLVTRFTFVTIPEPSIWILTGFGLVIMFVLKQRKS